MRAKNMNFSPYIYILYYQSNVLNYLPPEPFSFLIKWNISFVREVLEQPGRKNREHNIIVVRERHHEKVDKLRKLLAGFDVTPPRGEVFITWHFNVLHREMHDYFQKRKRLTF